jgi:hypothetical protein
MRCRQLVPLDLREPVEESRARLRVEVVEPVQQVLLAVPRQDLLEGRRQC